MNSITPPPELSLQGNVALNWRKFQQRFQLYIVASGRKSASDEVKTSLLLHVIGEDAIGVYNTFTFESEDEKMDYDVVIQKFESYCNPRKNVGMERHRFNIYAQTDETIDQYVTELKKKAQSCEFGDLQESLIRDRIISGIKDDAIRTRLLQVSDLTLEKALDICRAAESTQLQLKEMQGAKDLHAVSVRPKQQRFNYNKAPKEYSRNNSFQTENNHKKPFQKEHVKRNTSESCDRCSRTHEHRKCPAFGQYCFKCGGMNHFSSACKSKRKIQPKKVHGLSEQMETMFLGSINMKSKITDKDCWKEEIFLNNKLINFKLDTGAQVNVLPKKYFEKLDNTKGLEKTNIRLLGYGGNVIPVLGTVNIQCEHNCRRINLNFIVTNTEDEPILGRNDCEKLGLVGRLHEISSEKENEILKEYKAVFDGTGCVGKPYEIRLKADVHPIANPPRRVPIGLEDKLKEELKRMQDLGIIERVESPVEWSHNLVIVTKSDGTLRLCLDPRQLNEGIQREYCVMPTFEELVTKLKGAQYFSSLDAQTGFWQIPLSEKSANICTFGTPFGYFKFLRMPYGISSAPEVFQKTMQDMFGDIEGVLIYFDDILIFGATKEEHDQRLKTVLERAKEVGLKLNRKKCKFCQNKVKYLGHILSGQGIQIDPKKTEAILNMKLPANKKQLQQFIGMVTYLSKFIPNLSEDTATLRELIKDKTAWCWTSEHTSAVNLLKEKLSTPPVLTFFDASKKTTLSVDASKNGLGAVILQEGKPVAYASRALSNAERNYAQIEKEMVAIVFGVERFHHFIYGRQVDVETDHKPLEIIFRKPLVDTPPRLQRFLLRMQRYELNVKYIPGNELLLADALSRNYLEIENGLNELEVLNMNSLQQEAEYQVQTIIGNFPASTKMLGRIQQATTEDPDLQLLKKIVLDGWPGSNKSVTPSIRDFWNIREEITVTDSLILKGTRILIPKSLQGEILERLHDSHLGIEKTKLRARDVVFWPKMNKDIEEKIRSCETCKEHQRAQTREPLKPHEVPDLPWKNVATDIFEYKGTSFLLVIDFFSKFVEFAKLESTKSRNVINHLKSIFARHGIPDVLLSDNGPQFISQEFQIFIKEWDIQHKTSSPLYPRSNGLAERTVQTVKMMLKKAQDPYLALLEWRNTPIQDLGASPAQLLMGRRLRAIIPTHEKKLHPNVQDIKKIKTNLEKRQAKDKQSHDKVSREMTPLRPGENVRMAVGNRWTPATVIGKSSQPRSYLIESEGGRYRRNRIHLRKETVQPSKFVPVYEELDVQPADESRNQNVQLRNDSFPEQSINSENNSRIMQQNAGYATRSGRVVKKPDRYMN